MPRAASVIVCGDGRCVRRSAAMWSKQADPTTNTASQQTAAAALLNHPVFLQQKQKVMTHSLTHIFQKKWKESHSRSDLMCVRTKKWPVVCTYVGHLSLSFSLSHYFRSCCLLFRCYKSSLLRNPRIHVLHACMHTHNKMDGKRNSETLFGESFFPFSFFPTAPKFRPLIQWWNECACLFRESSIVPLKAFSAFFPSSFQKAELKRGHFVCLCVCVCAFLCLLSHFCSSCFAAAASLFYSCMQANPTRVKWRKKGGRSKNKTANEIKREGGNNVIKSTCEKSWKKRREREKKRIRRNIRFGRQENQKR